MIPLFRSRSRIVRLAAVLALLSIIFLFWALDLGRHAQLDELERLRLAHPARFLAAFGGAYILVAALSVPGATALTLLAGAIFGFWQGLAIVSFASAIGASCAFLAGRWILGDFVQRRFSHQLARLNEGIRREGAYYLFALRLIPVFPFFAVNLAMSLTPIRLGTFYWVSQLGMLPGTAAYVNAGTHLGRIRSLHEIMSPGLLASFAVIGILPLAARILLGRYRASWQSFRL